VIANDGLFYIDINDYIKFYSETAINYYQDGHLNSWVKVNGKEAMFEFKTN
jgi:hypothetical protein